MASQKFATSQSDPAATATTVLETPAGDRAFTEEEIRMRLLISALAAAGLFALSLSTYADEEKPYTATPPSQKAGRAIDDGAQPVKKVKKQKEHGRAIDEDAVKSGPANKAAGRAIDDSAQPVKKSKNPKPHGRAIDDGTVKEGGATDKPGRAIDDGTAVKTKKNPSETPGRAIEDSSAVKTKKNPSDTPGRAVEEEKKK